jgi:glyoxylase-like metal-dependent hydrolase (beta-lactamase superfamily II)
MPDLAASRDRRAFLRDAAACGAHIALLAAASPLRAARVFGPGPLSRVVHREPWARIEQVSDGIWAVISTPLEDRTTLCNGGIIRGRSGVLVIESFAQPAGAKWLAEKARELTGRWPDETVLTHYHGDHTGGLAGYVLDGRRPRTRSTATTRDLVQAQDRQRGADPASDKSAMLAASLAIDPARESSIDLGDRKVRIIPRDGHTKSDVTVEVDEPAVVFCGDLVWNRMFPNYVDAVPSRLAAAVDGLVRDRADTVYVPGHGPLADAPDLRLYIEVIDAVEAAARKAAETGASAAEAASGFRLPDPAVEWTLFSPRYFETAIGAWLKELRPGT